MSFLDLFRREDEVRNRKFNQVYHTYRMLMYRVAYSILGNEHDAEDAVQQAFFSILKNLENGAIKDILFIGTGALMSPMTLFQGEAIPGIAHLIRLRAKE